AARRLDARALRPADDFVAGDRLAAHRHPPAPAQDAEVRPLLAVDEDDRILVAQQGPLCGRPGGRHAGTADAPRARLASTSRTNLQNEQRAPYAGMPQTAHSCGSRCSTAANAGCAVRRNSFTNASFAPGLSASSRS